MLLVEVGGEHRQFKSVRRGELWVMWSPLHVPLLVFRFGNEGKSKLCASFLLYRSTRVCSEMRDSRGSGLSQGLCEGVVGGILLHLWDHDAPMELF